MSLWLADINQLNSCTVTCKEGPKRHESKQITQNNDKMFGYWDTVLLSIHSTQILNWTAVQLLTSVVMLPPVKWRLMGWCAIKRSWWRVKEKVPGSGRKVLEVSASFCTTRDTNCTRVSILRRKSPCKWYLSTCGCQTWWLPIACSHRVNFTDADMWSLTQYWAFTYQH